METTNNKLTSEQMKFFKKLSNYLDTKLYFYGSIQRDDYFTNDSDLDVAIFTDNTSSMLSKINNYFNIKKCEFKKFVWKLNITKNVVSGQKYMYTEPENNFKVEFCIYDEKYWLLLHTNGM